MKTRFYVILGCLWLAAGLLLGLPVLVSNAKSSLPATDAAPVVDNSQPARDDKPVISGQPTHIKFPKQNISVDVAPGYFDANSKTWTLSPDKAHFATVTTEPNNKTGNTFIYGHSRWEVFARLLESKIGDTAIVTTKGNHTFTYKLVAQRDVSPHDTTYIQDHKSPILTVQTCSGFWYENRRMLTYELREAR